MLLCLWDCVMCLDVVALVSYSLSDDFELHSGCGSERFIARSQLNWKWKPWLNGFQSQQEPPVHSPLYTGNQHFILCKLNLAIVLYHVSFFGMAGWPLTLENRENEQKKIHCWEKSGNLKKC